jgi:hypothetical protein
VSTTGVGGIEIERIQSTVYSQWGVQARLVAGIRKVGLKLAQDGSKEKREEGEELPFYLLEGVALVIFFYDFWGMDVAGVFPCVIAF